MIVTCGDSFSACVGLHDVRDGYAALLAAHYRQPLRNLACGGASNFAIWLQVKYACRLRPNLVVVSPTQFDRTEWIKHGMPAPTAELQAYDLAYHESIPFIGRPGPHPMHDEPAYNPRLICCGYRGVAYRATQALHGEPTARLDVLMDYFTEFYEPFIKKEYDDGLVMLMHSYLRAAGIPHIILVLQPSVEPLIAECNRCLHDWFVLANQYPDRRGSQHTSEVGHRLSFEKVKRHIDHYALLP